MAELIISAFAIENDKKLILKIIKHVFQWCVLEMFWNLLVLLFLCLKNKFQTGTCYLTHPEVTRYFMNNTEAAQLVIQASVLATGGDLFLLDMGEPLQIKNLAEQMIHLSGNSIRDNKNPEGDIEIVITGLRPGEKLYEELLIESEAVPTEHPLIFRANEKMFLTLEDFWVNIEKLENALNKLDLDLTMKTLQN